jgi:hypothetical protein
MNFTSSSKSIKNVGGSGWNASNNVDVSSSRYVNIGTSEKQ